MGDTAVRWATLADVRAVEAVPFEARAPAETVYGLLARTAARYPGRPALSFQLRSGPKERAETLDWQTLLDRVNRTANLFRRLGVGPDDRVAYLLPNCNETVFTLLGGLTAGIVCPINPLLEVGQIASILRETRARVLVTLAPFPKTDINRKAHRAAAEVGTVEAVLEVDLKRYLAPPLAWLVPFLRPRAERAPGLRVMDFHRAIMAEPGSALTFREEGGGERICAMFHTGGTTGMPKIAPHRQRGIVYNGVIPSLAVASHEDVLICPLPLFHVFAAYPVLMTAVAAGAHTVLPTPAGYRGEGVFDNFWKLVERWRVTFMVMVPTAAAALMQRPVNADVSTLRFAVCGSAPMPVELFRRFEKATGVKILEGYGMTEATCLISLNPPHGERRIGSVGLPIPYTRVRILDCAPDGSVRGECPAGEIGEICVASPGVFPGYTDPRLNEGLFTDPGGMLRTGDLGRLDEDGYLWITGRAKDLIIRGGHNIDPAIIEEALASHPAVAFVGAVGQPDARVGEVPCAYVELTAGAETAPEELLAFAEKTVPERAAVPKHIEILAELPKTAVGKVFKPELRKLAIRRVYRAALAEAGIDAEVEVIEDRHRGLVARIHPRGGAREEAIAAALDRFTRPWELAAGGARNSADN